MVDRTSTTLLVIDDDPDVLRATARILRQAGYPVITGVNAAEALDLTRRHLPALLLLDVMLPDGNGVDVARQLKSEPALAGVHIILLSGLKTSGEDQATGLGSGLADGYIARPFSKPEFLARIDAMLRLRSAQSRLIASCEEAQRQEREKSNFLANMSHEIRTPLHVIIGLGHLLRRDLTEPVQRDRLDNLCQSSEHLLALINDILDLSKIDAQRLTLDYSDFGIDAVVSRVMGLSEVAAHEKGLAFETYISSPIRDLVVHGDALRLTQVLINLCGNAVKFTDRGRVRLRVGCMDEEVDRITLRFIVEDTGIGIAAADRERLFQSFVQAAGSRTRERGGTGLGLVISQHLVGLMGGTIEVDSLPGSGSTFSFELTLPRATGRKHAVAETRAVPATTDFHGRHILFAEDHPLSQEILFEMLTDLGCEVDVASDGAEVVDCARDRRYDLILMDMQMPKMDGLAATRIIRTLPGHRVTPIVALTANPFAEDRQRCLDAGMNGYLSKPVTPVTLAVGLGQWLPELALPADRPPSCDNEVSRALAQVPGLHVGSDWLSSPQALASYCTQLKRFVELHAGDMALLREHLVAGENDAPHVILHRLIGISELIGARSVAGFAIDLMQGLRLGAGLPEITSMANNCEAELSRLMEAARTLPEQLSESTEK